MKKPGVPTCAGRSPQAEGWGNQVSPSPTRWEGCGTPSLPGSWMTPSVNRYDGSAKRRGGVLCSRLGLLAAAATQERVWLDNDAGGSLLNLA